MLRSLMNRLSTLAALWLALSPLGCKYFFGPGGRYAARDKNCVVQTLQSAPTGPYDDLGTVTIDCWTGGDDGCRQELLDEVCRRGGDTMWGLGDLAPSTTKLAARVARTKPVVSETK
jgi:hypothetical protein